MARRERQGRPARFRLPGAMRHWPSVHNQIETLTAQPTEAMPVFSRRDSNVPQLGSIEHESQTQDEQDLTQALTWQDTGAARWQEQGYYRAWLRNETRRSASVYSETARLAFIEQAQHPVRVRRQTVLPFAPVQRVYSAITTLSVGQKVAFAALATLIITGLYVAGVATLVTLLGLATFAYLVNVLLTAIAAVNVLDSSSEADLGADALAALADADWPTYTILCPLYHEAVVVPQFVGAMQAIDYPAGRLQVLLLTESDDEETRRAIRMLRLPSQFEVVTVPEGKPRTKPRACNYGLLLARGSFVVIYDAEDVPDPLQLKKAMLTFANHNASLACVQAKLGFYNTRQNLLTRWFAIEYALWFNITLPGLRWARMSLPLGGTSNHFRTDVLRRLGGWDAFNVTEDCDLGLRLAEHRFYTTTLDSTTLEEANSNVHNWVRQRSRWIKGYMQTYLVHLRHPWRYVLKRRIDALFSLFAIVGGTPATFIINPIMWALLLGYVISRQSLGAELRVLYIAPIYYPAVLCLVAGNFLYFYLYLIACVRSRQYGLLPWVLTMPLCWLLMCAAAVVAFVQLIFKPHYWEKTQHGLHLKFVARGSARQHANRQSDEPYSVRAAAGGHAADAPQLSDGTSGREDP